jgi:hypothetical protein
MHEQHKARKAHRCCECHGAILPGEMYHHHHGVWDGEPSDYKVCMDCEALRDECDRDVEYDECTPFGGLLELAVLQGEYVPRLLARFVGIMRKRNAAIPPWMEALVAAKAAKEDM